MFGVIDAYVLVNHRSDALTLTALASSSAMVIVLLVACALNHGSASLVLTALIAKPVCGCLLAP